MTEQNGVERSTATETLRAMLDERGVEWEDGGEGLTIIPVQDGVPRAWTVNTWPSGKDMGDCLWVQNRHPLTPEQAIAATLGREPDDAAMAKLHDQMNAAMFKYEMAQGIEKRDGDEAIVVPWVAKMHALLEEAATQGCGTCENEAPEPYYFVCSKCGIGLNFNVRFCPFCGRKVVDE